MNVPTLFSAATTATATGVLATNPGIGSPPLTADEFNTFVQSCSTLSDLQGFIPNGPLQVYLRGIINPGDGGQGDFWWNAANTLPNDNYNVVIPTNSSSAAWIRMTGGVFPAVVVDVDDNNATNFSLTYGPAQYFILQAPASVHPGVTFTISLNGTPTAPGSGWRAMLEIHQNSIGGNKWTFPSDWRVAGGGQAPTVSVATNAFDVFSVYGYTLADGVTRRTFLGVVGQYWLPVQQQP